MELWREISNYPNYLISSMGRVKSLNYFKSGEECILHPIELKTKYLVVNLYKEKQSKLMYIHKLVALAFIENPEKKPTIDHINKDRQNNHLENLRWATRKEQALNRTAKQTSSGEKYIYLTKDNKYTVQIRRNNKIYNKKCDTLQEAMVFRNSLIPT